MIHQLVFFVFLSSQGMSDSERMKTVMDYTVKETVLELVEAGQTSAPVCVNVGCMQ